MKLKVIVHEAEEGDYWAEVPAIPGCATQGETFQEVLKNLYEELSQNNRLGKEMTDENKKLIKDIANRLKDTPFNEILKKSNEEFEQLIKEFDSYI